MMYAYLLVTMLSGPPLWVPVGTAGSSWAACVELGNFAAAERRKWDRQAVRVVPTCVAGPVPK